MKRLDFVLAVVLVASAGVCEVRATDITITSFSGNGVLTWSNADTTVRQYAIEWASTLDGPWYTSWSWLAGIQPSNSTMSVRVPMFYRVTAVTNAVVDVWTKDEQGKYCRMIFRPDRSVQLEAYDSEGPIEGTYSITGSTVSAVWEIWPDLQVSLQGSVSSNTLSGTFVRSDGSQTNISLARKPLVGVWRAEDGSDWAQVQFRTNGTTQIEAYDSGGLAEGLYTFTGNSIVSRWAFSNETASMSASLLGDTIVGVFTRTDGTLANVFFNRVP